MKKNLIICGAPRAGTTSLFRYLSAHPSISVPYRKELNYFLGGGYAFDQYKEDSLSYEDYLSNFIAINDSIWTLEASPVYMHPWCVDIVAKRISALLPDACLLFILRDPIKRLYSQFMGEKIRSLSIKKGVRFDDYVYACRMQKDDIFVKNTSVDRIKMNFDGYNVGKYANILSVYLRYVPVSNVKILYAEDFFLNPYLEIVSLCGFLNLDVSPYENYIFSLENKMSLPRFSVILKIALSINQKAEPILNHIPALRKIMRNIYNTFNSKKMKSNEDILSECMRELILQDLHVSNVSLKSMLNDDLRLDHLPKWLK